MSLGWSFKQANCHRTGCSGEFLSPKGFGNVMFGVTLYRNLKTPQAHGAAKSNRRLLKLSCLAPSRQPHLRNG